MDQFPPSRSCDQVVEIISYTRTSRYRSALRPKWRKVLVVLISLQAKESPNGSIGISCLHSASTLQSKNVDEAEAVCKDVARLSAEQG
jgi:hypothetical protein